MSRIVGEQQEIWVGRNLLNQNCLKVKASNSFSYNFTIPPALHYSFILLQISLPSILCNLYSPPPLPKKFPPPPLTRRGYAPNPPALGPVGFIPPSPLTRRVYAHYPTPLKDICPLTPLDKNGTCPPNITPSLDKQGWRGVYAHCTLYRD